MIGVDATRVAAVSDAQVGCLADDLAHHPAGLHDAHGTQGLMVHAYVAARHEEVVDVAAVERAVGRPVGALVAIVFAVGEAGNERVLVLMVGGFGEVQVQVPAARERRIGVGLQVAEVVAHKDNIPHETSGLALASNVGSPLEAVVGVQAVDVLERVPGSVHGAQVEIAYAFHVLDRVQVETALPEPGAQLA